MTAAYDADEHRAGCDGKHRFDTRARAEMAVSKARRHPRRNDGSKGRIQSYRCRRCGGWHIGAYAVRKPPLPWRLRRYLRHGWPRRFDWRRALATAESEW